ncbi:sensor histidine kinase [Parabacteroides sp.]
MSDYIMRLLVSPGYRFCRHILLFVLSFMMISVNYYVNALEGNLWSQEITQSLVFLSLIYLSVFVLAPRFLLKNRIGTYILSIFLSIFIAIVLIYIIRPDEIYAEYKIYQFRLASFLFISSIIQLCLIIAGASAVIVFQHYIRYGQRIDQLENATIQSELEQLKNQINPHFLFNMLNNANVLIKENPEEAVLVLSKLKDLLKYQLKDSVSESVLLEDDIHFLNDYLNMEKVRRDNFDFIVTVEGDITGVTVPPLLFIPFVENAVKHNNDNRKLSYVHLYFKKEKGEDSLTFICVNSKPSELKERQGEDGGIGLANIRRRLQLLYDADHSLQIDETDITYTINLRLKLKE